MDEVATSAADFVTVRTTREADAARLRGLRIEALTLNPTAYVTTPEEAAADDWVARARDGGGDGLTTIFVAETAGGELVGMTGIVASGRARTRHSALIWGVYVRPAWRGRRLSERLVNAAVDWAAGKGKTIVRLGVTVGNVAAERVYVRCGFTVYGVERDSAVVDGVEHDEILMDRRIGRARAASGASRREKR